MSVRIATGPLQRALVVENPHPDLDQLLAEQGIDVRRVPDAPETPELIRHLQEHRAQVIFKRSRVPVSREVIEACPDLLAVQLCCIGDDSVDKQAAADAGLMVFNDPISNGRSVVEMVIGHLITLSRRFYETDRRCRDGIWEKNNTERYEIQGKTLGILGLGNIGRAVARAAEGMGMEIRFFDTRQVASEVGREMGWSRAGSIDELFATSDYVTVHLSAADVERHSNEGLLDNGVLMRLGADRPAHSPRIYLNLSRGFLHAPDALLDAISAGVIRRAAVDVYPREPRRKGDAWENPYRDEPRVVVTPHIGASTLEAQPRIAHRVARTLGHFSRFGSVRDCVYSPRTNLSLVDNGPVGQALLLVTHSTARGTKRAIDQSIYDAGASNLSSVHRDFDHLGLAYDLAALDAPLGEAALRSLVEQAAAVTGDERAIRSIRQITL